MRCEPAKHAGVTLPELMIAVVTAGILATAAGKGIEYASKSNAASNLANQGVTVYDSLQSYVADHIDALSNGLPVAGVANPMAPTQAEMRALGFATFSTTSTAGPGITWNYSLALSPAGCAPSCNVLVYVGLSGAPRIKDNTVDMPLVAETASKTGRPAGFSTSGSPTVISGLGGAWTLPNPVGNQAGILSIYGSYGAGQFGNYVRMGDTRPVTLNNKLTVQGAQTVGGTLAVQGNTSLNSTLAVAGNTTVGGSTTVTGNGSFGGSVSSSGNISAGGQVSGQRVVASDFVQAGGTVIAGANVGAAGSVVSNVSAVNYNGSTYNISNDWGMLTYAGNAALPWMNAEPQNARASLHVNDIYIRSVGKWASQLSAVGMSRSGVNGVAFNSDGGYSWVTVTVSVKYGPADSTHTAWSQWYLYVNGAYVTNIYDEIWVGKFGSSGHYWAYQKFGVEQKQFNVWVPSGALVQVVLAGGDYFIQGDVRVDLTP